MNAKIIPFPRPAAPIGRRKQGRKRKAPTYDGAFTFAEVSFRVSPAEIRTLYHFVITTDACENPALRTALFSLSCALQRVTQIGRHPA